jgi:hypothetical protein
MWSSGYREIQAILNPKEPQLIVLQVGAVNGCRRCRASSKGVCRTFRKKRTSSVPSLNTGCSKEIDLI